MNYKTVIHVTEESQFQKELEKAGIRLAVVYFAGAW